MESNVSGFWEFYSCKELRNVFMGPFSDGKDNLLLKGNKMGQTGFKPLNVGQFLYRSALKLIFVRLLDEINHFGTGKKSLLVLCGFD
jgi:hypothetical protein